MKRNLLQSVFRFLSKYMWIVCAVLVFLELFSTGYSAMVLMAETTRGVLQSVEGEVSGRVDGVIRLLHGLANDKYISNTALPLYDRAVLALPYQKSYDLYMIALTDEDVNVVSADETAPPTPNTSLAYREYMQELYKTGEVQITDTMVAGADNVTVNYTIAVPILKNDAVVGSVFGAIYFDDIQKIFTRYSTMDARNFYLLGKEQTLMAGGLAEEHGKSFLELTDKVRFFGTNKDALNADFVEGKSGGFWELGQNGMCYVGYQRVEPTQWTIIYQAEYWPVFRMLLPAMVIKALFYVVVCGLIAVYGRRYLERRLASVNHLLDKVATMQKQIFNTEQGSLAGQTDYENLLELTQKGLTDHLTGLSTRAILFNQMSQYLEQENAKGVLMFLDLDDLKRINDTFGHEAGDCALLHFAQVLKSTAERYDSIAARYGGDEFVLVINGAEETLAKPIAQQLCTQLCTTLAVKERELSIHGSIGVCLYPDHGRTLEDLICRADLALYSAKHGGKNRFVLYEED